MTKVQLEGVLKLVDVQVNPQVFRKISQSVAGMPQSLGKTNEALKSADKNARTLDKGLKRTGATLSQNERAARLFLQRMAQFAILLPTFATLNRAIQGGVKFLFEFDSALRDIVRIDISGLSDRLEEVGDAALQTAVDFGVTGVEVLNTTRVFKQAGFDIEESQNKARAAILATQISTLNSAQATEIFIAAQKQFVGEGENSIAVLDRLAKVEDVAAVNAADVAEAFRTGGNALAEFSGSIDDSIGLIAALREQTRKSGREIGTFFKTLQTRVFAAGESRNAVEALGVQVENLDGSLRPTLAVLNDVKVAFDGLNQAQQANAAKAIAGVRQFESLVATLNSLERANELSANSSEAAGTAEEKRIITDQKLERQLGKLIAQGQLFAESLGDAGFEDTLANALKIANGLLKVFTSLADTVGDLGGNLTPLLALAGVKLGSSVFGFQSGNKPGGGGGAAPGQQNFIGPLTQAQSSISTIGQDFKRLGGVVTNTGKLFGNLTLQAATNLNVSKQNGIQLRLDTQALGTHTAAIKSDAKALASSQVASLKQKNILTNSTAGLLALTFASSLIPKAFDTLEEKVRSTGGVLGEAGGSFVGIAGEGASLAAQFAFLGPQAAGIAAVFGAAQGAIVRFVDAAEDRSKALEELVQLADRNARISGGEFRVAGGGQVGAEAQKELLDALTANLDGAQIGKPLLQAIQNSLDQAAASDAFKDLELSGSDLRESLLGNINVLAGFISQNEDYIRSVAESRDGLDSFAALQEGLASQSLNTGQAFSLLVRALGAGQTSISEFGTEIERSLDLKEFRAIQDVVDFGESVRQLGLELQLAKLGPGALADDLVRLQQEFLLVERASKQTQDALRNELNVAIRDLGNVSFSQDIDFNRLLADVLNTPNTFDTDSIERFEKAIAELAPVERKAADQILRIVKEQTEDRLALQQSENDLLEEQNRRRRAVLEAETQATQNAFEAARRFNAELIKFGDAVNTNVLAAFQNVSLDDVDSVLAGTSELSDGIQQVILSAFADPITKAEQELQAVTATTQAELDILASKLDMVNVKLADEANAADKAALISEKRALELEIENTQQRGAIEATDAKIKILEAEKDAAEEAAEAEKARLEALEKLSEASRNFEKELNSIRENFAQFSQQKIADLLDREASARQELQEAQQDVLDSTEQLAEAYANLLQAQLDYNGAIAEAEIKSGLLAIDIGKLTGSITTFSGELNAIGSTFSSVLNNANISLEKRIQLEQQLAEETLTFLQQAKDEIVQSGLGIFGQTGAENQALGQGIAGLQLVAEQLGGSFDSFLNLSDGELSDVSQTLLGLPAEFRQQILDALSFLPSTANIGGFSVEQLTQAIGQVGAGVAPEAGLPSIEELNNQQVEQLTKLQELALQDAQLQFSQVVSAAEQLAAAEEQLEASKLLQERAEQGLAEVRDAVIAEKAVLDAAAIQQAELLNAVIAADDKNTLMAIEQQAQAFADQNSVFKDIGDNIVQGLSSAIGAKLAVIEAAVNVPSAYAGHIPNFNNGNLTPGEAAGLLRAGSREKRKMPGGAGLAVANTSETIIPARYKGYIPNFQDGNFASPISAGISAIKQINETVVAAIARSVTQALSDLEGGGNETPDLLREVIGQLRDLNDSSDDISTTNTQIQTNTSATAGTGATGGATTTTGANDVRITLETNQNNTISVSGLEQLRDEITDAVREAAAEQVDEQLVTLLEELDSIITALQERGLLSSFGQPR